MARDIEPKPGATALSRVRCLGLRERLEDAFAELLRNAVAQIGDRDFGHVAHRRCGHGHGGFGVGELAGIGQEVGQHLHDPVLVGQHVVIGIGRVYVDLDFPFAGIRLYLLGGEGDDIAQLLRFRHNGHTACVYLFHVQNVIYQRDKPVAVGRGDLHQTHRAGIRIVLCLGLEQPQRPLDRGQRRAQFVADGGDKVVLHLFKLVAFGDVDLNTQHPQGAPILRPFYHDRIRFDPAPVVLTDADAKAGLGAVGHPVQTGELDLLDHRRIIGMHMLHLIVIGILTGGVSGVVHDVAPCVRHHRCAIFQINVEDPDMCTAEREAPPLFGFRDLERAAFAVGDIAQHQGDTGLCVGGKPGVLLDLKRAGFCRTFVGRHHDFHTAVGTVDVDLGQQVLHEVARRVLAVPGSDQMLSRGIVQMQDFPRLPDRDNRQHRVFED